MIAQSPAHEADVDFPVQFLTARSELSATKTDEKPWISGVSPWVFKVANRSNHIEIE